MRNPTVRTCLHGVAALVLAIPLGHVRAQTQYVSSSFPPCSAMSPSGLVVGCSTAERSPAAPLGSKRIRVWDATNPTASPRELAPPSTRFFGLCAVNDAGIVVGNGLFPGEPCRRPFLSDMTYPTVAPKELAVPDGLSGSAHAINKNGMIVGNVNDLRWGSRAAVWSANGPAADPLLLPTPDESNSRALAVNDKGLVVGSISTEPNRRAVLWDAKNVNTPLQYLFTPNGSGSHACAINNTGAVAGVIWNASGSHAVVWDAHDASAAPRYLGEPESSVGRAVSQPCAINDNGLVVGTVSCVGEGFMFAHFPVLWENGATIRLPLPVGWHRWRGRDGVLNVRGINNRGQVVIEHSERSPKSLLFTPSATNHD